MRARDGLDPRVLGAMDLDEHLADPVLKAKYVRTVFDTIAPGYDLFTRLFSFGRDRSWKARLVEEGLRRLTHPGRIVDLACGTGDLGTEIARRTRLGTFVGVDFSPVMLAEAAGRRRDSGVTALFVASDIQQMCLPDRSAGVISIGYGIRNAADARRALSEVARVLKPGGILLSLDFYKPRASAWRELFLWYMWQAGRLAGFVWHREPMAYGYLAPSIRGYVTMAQFEQRLREAGFVVEWSFARLGGAIGLHVARRLAEPPSGRP